jgi:hypothetical protein
MSILCISVSEKGVKRVDVLYSGADEYPRAAEFHKDLSPEIAKLDKFVRRRYKIRVEITDKS